MAVAELAPSEIEQYFREHPDVAGRLLTESSDKRYSPASFISEEADGFAVGWFSPTRGYECVRRFEDLSHAATDYLLFTLGRGRLPEPEA